MGVSYPLRPENQPPISREEEDARIKWVMSRPNYAFNEEQAHVDTKFCKNPGDREKLARERLLERWYPGPPHIMTGEPLRTYLKCLDFANWKLRPVAYPENLPAEVFEKIACFYPEGPVVLIRTGEILQDSFMGGKPSVMVFLKALAENPDWTPEPPEPPMVLVPKPAFFKKLTTLYLSCCLAAGRR